MDGFQKKDYRTLYVLLFDYNVCKWPRILIIEDDDWEWKLTKCIVYLCLFICYFTILSQRYE